MSKTDRAWEKWAEKDPYYGVFSTEDFRKDNLTQDALAQFFATGEAHVAHVFDVLGSRVAPGFVPVRAVDFGCGTGRLVLPLARRCRTAIGIDVAPAMLAEARRNADAQGLDNVELLDVEAGLARAAGADLIHSFIVFQHIGRAEGMRIIGRLVGGLAPGGCLALHLTFERNADRLRKFVFWARHNVPLAQYVIQLLLGRPPGDAPMQMNHYSLNEIFKLLHNSGVRLACVETTDHGGFLGMMIFARKADGAG